MTVSSSPCSRKLAERARALLSACLLVLAMSMLGWSPATQAASPAMELRTVELVPLEQGYVVNASLEMASNAYLQELVESGLSVPFIVEFTLTRGRWYWLDETVAERTMSIRLAYHALTRQYRLTVGSIHRSFRSYEEAVRAMLAIRNWQVADVGDVREGEPYRATLRMRLDMSQLPKPFQVAALGNRDLDLNTGWVRWTVIGARPAEAR